MKKIISFLIFVFVFECCANSQPPVIKYGNYEPAGEYYSVRGFKMYCEVYGSGKPLIMIHGNGGSIGSFRNNIAYFAKKI